MSTTLTPLEKAKQHFEETVQRMQADLISYAGRPSSNLKAVETRKTNINNLVEYYQQVEIALSQSELDLMEKHFDHNRLREDVTRLIYLCKLHGVNPNLIFMLSLNDLSEMIALKMQIMPTMKTPADQKFIQYPDQSIGVAKPAPSVFDLDSEIRTAPYITKYFNALATLHYAQKTK